MNEINLFFQNSNIGNLQSAARQISTTINGVFGAFSGLIGLALIIMAIYYFVKLSTKADNPEEKRKYLNAIRWVGLSFIAILVIWAISGFVVGSLTNVKFTS
ncbi:Mbov_0395 family pilin-like conjugal transfer protein [Mycoplasmopsis pulmonis]|nr:pilin [Mycoplasmopsis pulmonis]MDZ7293339.1 pilin [Mycoplasmopsis pulmonis]VEU68148.1 Uncharacterised protein [Mycoplasmopsis pulmonis]